VRKVIHKFVNWRLVRRSAGQFASQIVEVFLSLSRTT
jgi:hypothetical protein